MAIWGIDLLDCVTCDLCMLSGTVVGSFPSDPFRLGWHQYTTNPEKTYWSRVLEEWGDDALYQEDREWYGLRAALVGALKNVLPYYKVNLPTPDQYNHEEMMPYVYRFFTFRREFISESPAMELARRPLSTIDEEDLRTARVMYSRKAEEDAYEWLTEWPRETHRRGLELLLDMSVIPPGEFFRIWFHIFEHVPH